MSGSWHWTGCLASVEVRGSGCGLGFSCGWFVLAARVVSVMWACCHGNAVMSLSQLWPHLRMLRGRETQCFFALDLWLMNLGSNYTEKHVQDPGNFKNFLPLKNPSVRFPPWLLHHGLNRGKVSGSFLSHEPWASFVKQRLRAFTPSKWLSCRVGFGDPGLLHLGLLFNIWRGGASL